MINPEKKLVEFITDTELSDVPRVAKERVQKSLLDTLGAGIAGSGTRAGEIIADFVTEVWKGGEATVFLNGRSSTVGASLANGYMANALDIDDGGKHTRGHPGAQLVPAALALCEQEDKSGEDLLSALAIGYETAHRVGGCWHSTYEDYRSCGSWGAVACAAVGAKLLGLSKEKTRNSLAIADYNSPYLPMNRALEYPSMVKHGAGAGSMTGIMAAEWAARGFTGPSTTLTEGDCGKFFEDLGDHFVLSESNAVEYKDIPSCSWGHPAIKAAQELIEGHDIAVEDIGQIEVEGFTEMASLYEPVPSTEEEAQFSVKWPLTAAIVDGEVTPENTSPIGFDDPEKIALFEKIEVSASDKLDRMNRSVSRGEGETSAWPSRVRIRTKDGETFDSGVTLAEGDREVPFDQLTKKFVRLTAPYLSNRRAQEIIQAAREVETLANMERITSPIRGREQ